MPDKLTELEYLEFIGDAAPDKFNALVKQAVAELNPVTRFFYEFNPLDDDFKGRQFKHALAMQVKFYVDAKTTSSDVFNNKPDTVSIGDTTINYNRTISGAKTDRRTSMVSQDALNLLRGTGLLYRGAWR